MNKWLWPFTFALSACLLTGCRCGTDKPYRQPNPPPPIAMKKEMELSAEEKRALEPLFEQARTHLQNGELEQCAKLLDAIHQQVDNFKYSMALLKMCRPEAGTQ